MKILVASSIDPHALEELQRQHEVICAFNAGTEELKTLIADREVLIFRSGVQITAEVMACAPQLRLILRGGSGVDNIDLEYVQARGIRLVRIPGPGAKAVAEMSFALMLGLARNVLQADHLLRQGKWAKREMTGHQLTGKVLGIIGAGNIGARTGELGAAWGMQVLGCVEHPSPEAAARLLLKGITLMDRDEILARSDFISLHVPLKASTRNMIDAAALNKMKRGAFLINLARGGVVDEAALLAALQEGHLSGAALDVHQAEGNGKISPLADLPNVILTPHIGASTFDSQREIGVIILEQVEFFMQNLEAADLLPKQVVLPVS
jgi:D-3-phosphoglycerate dehydrogenase